MPPSLADRYIDAITAAFTAAADPGRAAPMAAYQRHQFAFLGIGSADRTALRRAAWGHLPALTVPEIGAVVRRLWARDEREYQYVAADLLRGRARHLPSGFLPVVGELVATKSWWDTVDVLAIHVVGTIVRADRRLDAVMDDWLASDDRWLARTAILHQHCWKEATDADRLFAACRQRADDTDFFVRKAIGWALREYSKTDPEAVRRFVADHHDELSGLSRREALKWLDRTGRPAARSAGPGALPPP